MEAMPIIVDHRIFLCRQWLGGYCSLLISRKYWVVLAGQREEIGARKAMKIVIWVESSLNFPQSACAHILSSI